MDPELRRLATRDPGSAAHLAALVRAGSLSREHLEVAAHCQHAPAAEVLGWDVQSCVGNGYAFGPWVVALHRRAHAIKLGERWCSRALALRPHMVEGVHMIETPVGPMVCPDCRGTGLEDVTLGQLVMVRAAVAVGWAYLPQWNRDYGFEWSGPNTWVNAGLNAVADWITCPCEQHLQAWLRIARHLDSWWVRLLAPDEWARPFSAGKAAALGPLLKERRIGEARARAVIQNALVPWILGAPAPPELLTGAGSPQPSTDA